LVNLVKYLARRLVLPVVEGPFLQQEAWNSEVLRRLVELETENRFLRFQIQQLSAGESGSFPSEPQQGTSFFPEN
jgi:hypothetical protein